MHVARGLLANPSRLFSASLSGQSADARENLGLGAAPTRKGSQNVHSTCLDAALISIRFRCFQDYVGWRYRRHLSTLLSSLSVLLERMTEVHGCMHCVMMPISKLHARYRVSIGTIQAVVICGLMGSVQRPVQTHVNTDNTLRIHWTEFATTAKRSCKVDATRSRRFICCAFDVFVHGSAKLCFDSSCTQLPLKFGFNFTDGFTDGF